MADMNINDYRVFWNAQSKQGRLELHGLAAGGKFGVEDTVSVDVNDPSELRMLVDILRNEKPVHFDRGSQTFETIQEPTGEGEDQK